MIEINLLPPDIIKSVRYQQRRIPIVPVLVMIFFILVLYWVIIILSIAHLKVITQINVKKVEEIAPKKADVDVIWNSLNNDLNVKKEQIDTYMRKKLEWAMVLNMVSDYTSQGIWLYDLDMEYKDDYWLLTLHGYAKPVTARSMIKDIGNYVTNVKEHIETSMQEKINDDSGKTDFVEVTTTTKRKKADRLELTEFVTIFKIEP